MLAITRLVAAAVTVSASALPAFALAQDYPTRPVKIVVPFAAGGPADIYARFLGQKLQDALGQNFVVENKPGGGAVIGTNEVAKSAPDGYTLLMMSNTHTVNETLITNRPYQLMQDFVPVAPVNYSDLVLVVHPSVQATSVADLLKLAKSQPDKLNYASSGPGTPYHMAGELFKALAGVKITHVPYKGSSGARADVLAGHVQMMFDAVTTMAPQAKAGKVRALATSGKTRSTVMPELPTVAEAGVPGYDAVIWLGIMAPAKTPAPIVAKLNAEIGKIVGSAEVGQAWGQQGAVPMRMSTDEFGKYLNADIEKWAKIVKISGAKQE
ncbi:MAG TPA: tripartite tricarboxylate transporter substrate binding protein [Burkholderiaceae bacterium]